jgi:hypothetical protein
MANSLTVDLISSKRVDINSSEQFLDSNFSLVKGHYINEKNRIVTTNLPLEGLRPIVFVEDSYIAKLELELYVLIHKDINDLVEYAQKLDFNFYKVSDYKYKIKVKSFTQLKKVYLHLKSSSRLSYLLFSYKKLNKVVVY